MEVKHTPPERGHRVCYGTIISYRLEAVAVAFRVACAVVPRILHGGKVALLLLFLDPEVPELNWCHCVSVEFGCSFAYSFSPSLY